jgi:hypothetical protein
MTDIYEMVRTKESARNQRMTMPSGSSRDGFRIDGSDRDLMHWRTQHRVIWDFSQRKLYNDHSQTLILMITVSSDSPPGFALLQLLTPIADRRRHLALVIINGGCYISSSKYRLITCSDVRPNSTINGPCSSGVNG